jgi:hypothetical protein
MPAATRLGAAAALVIIVLSGAPIPVGHAAKWDPIDPKELALTTPSVDKNADAEALLWEVRVADQRTGDFVQTVFSHSLRIKIFTDRGREAQSRIDIPISGRSRVMDVEARSVKRDGTYVEVKGSDIFTRDLVRASGVKIRATSFVLPAVETGGVIEYRWREFYDDSLAQNLRLPLSRDIPVRLVKYYITPLDLSEIRMGMRWMPFHANPTPLVKEGRNLWMTSLANVPAHKDEPRAPSDWEVRPWLLVYYDDASTSRVPAQFWATYSRAMAESQKKEMNPSGDIKRAAASLSLGSASFDQKLAALVNFCRAKIKRIDVDTVSDAELKGFKPNKSATAALAAGRGTAYDMATLFVAMARAVGLDARLALLPNRSDVAFDAGLMLPQLLRQSVVAVRDGNGWRFVDPTNTYAPNGHLEWRQEMLGALIPDENGVISAMTPTSPQDFTVRKRVATLALSEDGTLEGDVSIEYTGHRGMDLKESEDDLAPAEREKSLRELMTERLPGIEMAQVSVENVTEIEKPYTTRYHMKVPGYAQRTGSRLFIQPAVFQKGLQPEFPASQRRYPIYFDYAWKDVDQVRIALPSGFELESAAMPSAASFDRIGGHVITLVKTPDGTAVELTREFFFGADGRLQFPTSTYPAVKSFFDEVSKADAHTIALRKAAGGAGLQ